MMVVAGSIGGPVSCVERDPRHDPSTELRMMVFSLVFELCRCRLEQVEEKEGCEGEH